MNTHIIIPIKDIREYHTKLGQKELFSRYKNAKQISLDEKDIEEKAAKQMTEYYSKENNPKMDDISRVIQRLGAYIGYKQALKDLL